MGCIDKCHECLTRSVGETNTCCDCPCHPTVLSSLASLAAPPPAVAKGEERCGFEHVGCERAPAPVAAREPSGLANAVREYIAAVDADDFDRVNNWFGELRRLDAQAGKEGRDENG